MNFIDAILLGILQGATEFLPVSSSGHLVLAQYLLDDFRQPGVLFDVLLHVGTMVAVVLYFRRDLLDLFSSLWRRDAAAERERSTLVMLLVASIPTAVIGLSFKDFFEGLFERPDLVCLMLLVTGSLLWLAQKLRDQQTPRTRLTILDALIVGTAQGAAIIPGISRAGATIASLLLRGIDGETAARFSFLLALPAVFGAALISLKDLEAVATADILPYLAGTTASMIAGLLCIHLLLLVLRNQRLHWFAIYCWAVGLAGSLYFWL
ncbi:MAG: undecaprenyl-diphosphate phosphatase [Desulfuromonadales bacterium]|nr:undecaprenyl-diphosphate phosphatase [Desulfuromonadales bacterium]